MSPLFVVHKSANCPNNWPTAMSYHTLTQANVDHVHTSQKLKPVATTASVVDDKNTSQPVHPVAAILGSSATPVAYMANNISSVIEHGEESTSDVSISVSCIAPCKRLFSNHLFWDCSTTGSAGDVSSLMHSMLDCGCHTVLIHEELAESLALKRQTLYKPETIGVTIVTGKKGDGEITLMEWVKLKVEDPSRNRTVKMIRAIIYPGLCAPLILGLPFLKRNEIVIDCATCTAIHKPSSFDLLNPQALEAKQPPKLQLKEVFTWVCASQKEVLAELKGMCMAQHHVLDETEEKIKAVAMVMAVQQRMEVLAAQAELMKLGDEMKKEFVVVFKPIPHVDSLPTDVYCHIKLKDVSQRIAT
jgi:hypothetical protein